MAEKGNEDYAGDSGDEKEARAGEVSGFVGPFNVS